jgi:hypothetical protein
MYPHESGLSLSLWNVKSVDSSVLFRNRLKENMYFSNDKYI